MVVSVGSMVVALGKEGRQKEEEEQLRRRR